MSSLDEKLLGDEKLSVGQEKSFVGCQRGVKHFVNNQHE